MWLKGCLSMALTTLLEKEKMLVFQDPVPFSHGAFNMPLCHGRENTVLCRKGYNKVSLKYILLNYNKVLSHNNPCFQCNIAITNFRPPHTCEIRLDDVPGQSTVSMYSYAKNPKHSWPTWSNEYELEPYFLI